MSWQIGEVWLDTEVLWSREQSRGRTGPLALALPAFPAFAPAAASAVAMPPGLAASQRRRALRRRRHTTRTVPAIALAIGSSVMLPLAAQRDDGGGRALRALLEDPPSQTFRLGLAGLETPEAPLSGLAALYGLGVTAGDTQAAGSEPRQLGRAEPFAEIAWHRATSRGLPYAGRLGDGTQLPVAGTDWVTWNPVTDSSPNLPHRLYGHERTIRTITSVLSAYGAANPGAPRVVVGDISFRNGGQMNEHVSHQNGLDVDIYYPRLDHALRAPRATGQIDRALAQDLLDRFLAAGARVVFVGYATDLRGPSGVVVPYPNHENHMHVRFPTPPA